jgi:hypothetical protein
MKQKILLLLLLLTAWGARAQAPSWQSALSSAAVDVRDVALTTGGDVYVTGTYTGSVTFGPNTISSNNPDGDVFVAKWAAGAATWAWGATLGGSTPGPSGDAINQSGGIAVNGNRVYVIGHYHAATFTSGGNSLTNNAGNYDMFVARFTDNTTSVAASGLLGSSGGASSEYAYGIAVSPTNGNVYVTGYFGSTASPNATISGTALTSSGSADVYIAKYFDNGTTLSNGGAGRAGGASAEVATCLALSGNTLYVGGRFGSSGTSVMGSSTLTSAGANDIFVARFTDSTPTATGGIAANNALRGGGDGADGAQGIAVNGSSVYLMGYFNPSTVATTLAGSTLANAGNTDIFVAKYTDNGSALVNGYAIGDGTSGFDDNTQVSFGGDIAVVGSSVYVTSDFDTPGNIAGTNLTNAGGTDAFVAKYTDTGSTFADAGAVRGGGAGNDTSFGIAVSGTQGVVGGNMVPTASFGTQLTSGSAYAARVSFAAAPTVTTATPTTITSNSAVLGGNVTADGGATVTDRGVVYSVNSTNANPTIGGTGVTTNANSTSGTGAFSATISGLAPSTTYAVRAYATNSAGTSYGSPLTLTTLALPTVTSLAPPNGPVGTNVTITGTGFAPGATVTFNGTTATTVTVNSATQITATVPAGATTGNVVVTTSAGSSNAAAANVFTVTVPTTVTSITTATTSPTNSGSISYTVTFANSVTGLTVSNFSLSPTVTGASVSSVSGSGTTYTVVVSTGSGDGTLQLNLANSTGLSPSVSNVPFAGPAITIDKTRPSVAISSTAGGNNGTTATTPIPFTVTFSEAVTGFVAGDVTVSNGAITAGSFSGSGATYTFNVTPSGSGSTVAVNIATNVAQDAAGNGNTAASQFSITYQQPLVANAQAVTVNLDANGNATLTANSVNNNSTGAGTLTYTIQKIAFGYISEGTTPLTLTTPNGANFTQIRFASYGTPTNSTSGNYSLGSCNASNSLAAAQNAYVGRSSGSMYASNTDTRNNPVLGDPCGGTPKALAVQAAYSADAASLAYDCTEAGKTQYVLLTVTNGTSTSTSVAQVTVNAPPTATISSVSPTTAQRGATVTVAGTNLSGVSSVTVNGAAATVSNLTSTGFTFVVPGTAAFGTGSIVVATPCAQTLTNPFSVTAPALTATVSTTSASPTSTAPIPFSVTFSQSVGTTFVASDVTVAGGTVTSGSFSGSGAGPYTFTVTPSGTGTVAVSLAASVANDANNTQNTASNSVSVQFQAPTIVVAPASLPQGTQNTAYSQALSASGGTAPYTYAITAGALPNGLSLSSSGTIAGTPAANGTFNFTVTATDASAAPGPYSGSRSYSLVINTQPVTAAPVVTTPANGSFSNNRSVTVAGTAPANSTVSVFIGALAGTTQASAAGAFSYVVPTSVPDGTYTVSATAQSSGATASASSNVNTFTIDGTAPTVTLSSTVASGGTTTTSPVSFTATFSESVTNFAAAGITVTNGTVTSGPTAGANNAYTFQVTPSAAGTVTVRVAANAAQDQATNGNTASAVYSLTFAAPTIAVSPNSLPNGQQGVAYSQALSASGGTAPYTYAITAGALPAGLSLNTSGTIAGTPTTNGTFTFTVTATDASTAPGPYSGTVNYSLVITAPAITTTIWTGTISTDWFTAGNWTQGVPTATIDATIPTAPSGGRFPALSAGTANVRNLTFNSGSTLNQSGGTLAIAANLTNNGTFLPTGGTVNLGTTTLSNVLGSSNIRFWNLAVGVNGAQLSTSIGASVQRLLTLNGNFATNGNQFVLESTNTLTALVVNNSGNVVTGTVTVQRAIDPSVNPGLGYRHYSAPVSNSTVGDLATSGFTPVVNPAFNTDATPYSITPYPTVYGYDDSRLSLTNNLDMFDKGYYSPSALSDPLAVGKGYTVNIAASEVVDFQGTLNNGDLSLNLTSTRNTYPDGGWQFLGNPYPAPLDYSRVAAADRNGLESAIYVYSSTSQYQGRYRVYINGIGNPVVPLGQGYFTRVASGQTTATMTFRNSQRLTAPNGTTLQRTTADPRPLVQLTLQGQGAAPADEAYVYFENGATTGFEPAFDAEKLPNPTGFNLSTTQAGKQLSIDGQPELGTAQRVVPLAVGVPAAGVYTFTASQLLNLSATPVYLRDLQLGTLTDLRQQPTYQFTVSNASALNTTRFALVFSPQQALATVPAALAEQVGLYPNPARTQVAIELPLSLSRQPVTAALLDALGRVVRTQVLPAGLATHSLPLADLASGVYSLRLTTDKGMVVKKLVIE